MLTSSWIQPNLDRGLIRDEARAHALRGQAFLVAQRGRLCVEGLEVITHDVLGHQCLKMAVTLATMTATDYLSVIVSKGFFPRRTPGVSPDRSRPIRPRERCAAQYQYTLHADNVKGLNDWAPQVFRKFRTLPQQTASRLGITSQAIERTGLVATL
jgi:hypothetical protein